MLRPLLERGRRLEGEGGLPPPGFYDYSAPIRWVVHVWPVPPVQVHLAAPDIDRPRPYDGRTSAIRAHPLADEAGYVLGVDRMRGGGRDNKAAEKHQAFVALLRKALDSPEIPDPLVRRAIGCVLDVLDGGLVAQQPGYADISSKDWVSFVFEEGALAAQQLFERPEVRAFWVKEVGGRTVVTAEDGRPKRGQCAICGSTRNLAGKIPLGVKLFKPIPLHSQYADAFVSFIEGKEVYKEKAHIGICWECGDTIARTLNELSGSPLHRRNLVTEPKNTDSLTNQVALFWLKEEASVLIGTEEVDPEFLLQSLAQPLGEVVDQTQAAGPPPELGQLAAMLDLPWTAREGSLRLAENAFHLLVLSPNVGRIAIREWVEVSLEELRGNLRLFLTAQRITDPSGQESRAFPLPTLLGAMEADSSGQPGKVKMDSPGLMRSLLRTAYLGHQPPEELLETAVMRFRVPDGPGGSRKSREAQERRRHVLVAAMKLVLTYRREEAEELEKLDSERGNPARGDLTPGARAYLCGRLLAVLEEIQWRSQRSPGSRTNTTVADRFYGAASTTPAAAFAILIKLAETAHLPKLRREGGYDRMRELLESVLGRLQREDGSDGFPATLKLRDQAEFALGFYHQRGQFRVDRAANQQARLANQGQADNLSQVQGGER